MSELIDHLGLYQKSPNCVWYVNKKPKCDKCGYEVPGVQEIRTPEGELIGKYCLGCSHIAMREVFQIYQDIEFIICRWIEYEDPLNMKPIDK